MERHCSHKSLCAAFDSRTASGKRTAREVLGCSALGSHDTAYSLQQHHANTSLKLCQNIIITFYETTNVW